MNNIDQILSDNYEQLDKLKSELKQIENLKERIQELKDSNEKLPEEFQKKFQMIIEHATEYNKNLGNSVKLFVDSWLSALAFISFVVLHFFVFNQMGTVAVNFLPFILIITSYFVSSTAKKFQLKETLLPYFTCLNVLQIISLVMMYAAGNYFVVRESGHALLNQPDVPMFLPFKNFFYAYTLITPVILVYAGLKNKNSI